MHKVASGFDRQFLHPDELTSPQKHAKSRLQVKAWARAYASCFRGLREWTQKTETKVERRYFITSLKPDAAKIAKAVRSHWGIENAVHWVLDSTRLDVT